MISSFVKRFAIYRDKCALKRSLTPKVDRTSTVPKAWIIIKIDRGIRRSGCNRDRNKCKRNQMSHRLFSLRTKYNVYINVAILYCMNTKTTGNNDDHYER